MNYGETIAFWYLRLNGFFPLANLVVHHQRGTPGGSADIDIVAVRLPHVEETVGGMADDWDADRFRDWGLDLRKTLGLLVEVKTGADNAGQRRNIALSFGRDRIEYGLKRMGIWPAGGDQFNQICQYLERNATSGDLDEDFVVGKLLVADQLPQDPANSYLKMRLSEARDFILGRIAAYDEKYSDRLRFSDELIQYMIWDSRRRQVPRPTNEQAGD